MVACNFIGMLLYKTLLSQYYFGFFPFLVLLMFAISSIVISVTGKAVEKGNAVFVNTTMVTSILKLILLALFFLLYAWLVKEQLVSFFASFVVLYIIFTGFETVFRAKLNRSQNELDNK